jgi:hypothetical protein
MSDERNMYGCFPCPKCGSSYRYPNRYQGRAVIRCDNCGRHAPWDGTWAGDGYSVNETPEAKEGAP